MKFKIAKQIREAFTAALSHPNLLQLNQELALMNARQDQLQKRLEEVDLSGTHRAILNAVETIETGIISNNTTMTARGLTELRKAVNPIQIEESLWRQTIENIEVVRRLSDTERKWATANKQSMDISMVLELLLMVQRISFRYIPSHRDRAKCAEEIRSYLP